MIPKTARDLVVLLQDYPHARDTATLMEAVELLETWQIELDGYSSMPRILLVLGDNNQLLGYARRRDILRGIEPEFHGDLDTTHPEAHFKTEIDPNLTDLIPVLDPERLRKKLSRPLGEVVREMEAIVDIDDSLMKIVRVMVDNDTHIAAVVDEDENVVGVVRSLDVLRAVIDPLHESGADD